MGRLSANLQLTRKSYAGLPPSEEGAYCRVIFTLFVQSR